MAQSTVLNFDTYADGTVVPSNPNGIDATSYFAGFGITLVPTTPNVLIFGNVPGFTPTSGSNFIEQFPTYAQPASFTLTLPSAGASAVSFWEIGYSSPATYPQFTATFYDGSTAIGSVGTGLTSGSNRFFQFAAPSGDQITSVTFASNGFGFTGIGAPPIDDFSFVPESQTGLSIAPSDKAESPTISLTENASGNVTSQPQQGAIHFTDADPLTLPSGAILTQTVHVTDAFGIDVTGNLTASQISALESAFTISAAPANTNNGEIDWTYNPQGTALDFLLEGETALITSTVQVTDQDGNSDTATVAVSVHGAPDKLHFDVVLGPGGYGTIAAYNNGQPLALSSTGSNTVNVAYDDLMPIPAATYNVTYRQSPTKGPVLEFSAADGTSDFFDRDNIQIHIGNTPGDSTGCIVTGDGIVDGMATNNYWSGLLNVLKSIAKTENLAPDNNGYFALQNPITVTVSGDTAQPTLQVIPPYKTLQTGQSEIIFFSILGLQPSTPIVDKDINVYFEILGANGQKLEDQSLVNGASLLIAGPHAGDFEATISGRDFNSQFSTAGSNNVAVVLNTAGITSNALTIQIDSYDGTSYLTLPVGTGTPIPYNPSGGSNGVLIPPFRQPLLEASQPVSISLLSSKASKTVHLGANASIELGDGNDTVTAGVGSTISLGNGNDTVSAGANSTISIGNGNDTVNAGDPSTISAGNGNDTINGGDGCSITGGDGNDKVTAGIGSTIGLGNGNDKMIAGDHSMINVGNGNDNAAGGNACSITVGNGNDLVAVGSGSTVNLRKGHDTVAFGTTLGNETVNNFSAGSDRLQFNSALFANFAAAFGAAQQVGLDTVITYDPNDTVTLHNVALTSLSAKNFQFA